MSTLRTIATIILAMGGVLVFNEAETLSDLWVNFAGFACIILAAAINIDEDTLRKIQGE